MENKSLFKCRIRKKEIQLTLIFSKINIKTKILKKMQQEGSHLTNKIKI